MLRVAERELAVDLVAIAAADPRFAQVAGVLEIADDLPGGPLGDPNGCGDVTQLRVGVGGDACEHVRMVRDEAPQAIVISRT
jgi:hypothetical protein